MRWWLRWTAAVATILIEILRRISRYRWSFSRLLKFVRLNLLTYKKLDVWINRPDFRVQKQSPPKTQQQMALNFDWKWLGGPTFKPISEKPHIYWGGVSQPSLCTFLIWTPVVKIPLMTSISKPIGIFLYNDIWVTYLRDQFQKILNINLLYLRPTLKGLNKNPYWRGGVYIR